MDKRLQCLLSHVPEGRGLIDVGTDHAYLVAELARRGYQGRLFASDINEGPLSRAREHMRRLGLEERVELQLCDGLALCRPDSVDTIVVAGMGGDTICGILDRAEWCWAEEYYLILQPMTRAEVLRYWLVNNGFSIREEDLVEENGQLYAVICARFGGNTGLSDAELYTGAFAQIREHPLGEKMIRLQLRRFEKQLNGLMKSDRPDERLPLIETMIKEWKEMLKDADSSGAL